MKKEPLIFLQHIQECIYLIEEYTEGLTKAKFKKDIAKQDAIIRRLEIIGEALTNVPTDFRKKYPEVSWRQIIATRNKLIHEYFGVDLDVVWNIVKKDLPILKNQIDKIFET